MPRKKRTDDDGNEHYQQVVEMDPQDAKVRKILQAMPGGLKCMNLFRYPEGNKGGRPEYIDEISPEQFSFQGIKQSFGGGRFFVEWENADGTCTRSNFDIAGSYRDFKDPKPVEDEEDDEPMKQIPQPQPVQQNGIDPVQLMMMLQKAEERAEARIIKMMEMLRPQQIQQPPDMTKQVFEIVEKLAPMMQGDGGNPILSVIGQFREPIMKIIDSVHAAMTRPAVAPSGPPPFVHAHVEQPNTTKPTEDDMMKVLIRQYLPVFVNAARSNGNPDVYADMILDQIPEIMYPKLANWLLSDTWFQDIVAIEKNVEFQAGWWNLLRASIVQGVEEHAASNLQPAPDSEHSED